MNRTLKDAGGCLLIYIVVVLLLVLTFRSCAGIPTGDEYYEQHKAHIIEEINRGR